MYSSTITKTVTTGEAIPLVPTTGVGENIFVQNNELKLIETPVEGGAPSEMEALGEGIYVIFCYVRGATGSNGNVALMYDGAMLSNTVMAIDNTHLTQSQMTITNIKMGKPIKLVVQSGSIVLATGENVNIIMFKIKDLPPTP